MKLWVLGSGSGGNAVLVESGSCRVLVDAGFGTRTLAARLHAIDIAPTSIEACIVTHEHTDHVKGAAAAARRWGWSVIASEGTVDSCPELASVPCTRVVPGASVALSELLVTTQATPHDAASPIGVRLTCTRSGARAVVCTDVGHASDGVRTLCSGADLLVLESNHDEGMLRAGPYPPSVRARIASRTGHLSNRASAELARELVHAGLAHVVLAHLSQRCNDREVAQGTMSAALRRTRFRGRLSVASQDGVLGPLSPRAGGMHDDVQFSLGI